MVSKSWYSCCLLFTGQGNTSLNYRQSIRDPAVQLGKPLPGKGSCKHYKQSHRWLRSGMLISIAALVVFEAFFFTGKLVPADTSACVARFPCCGRAYPCDVCHDEDQDHLMELASRMICGHCAKEQVRQIKQHCKGSCFCQGHHSHYVLIHDLMSCTGSAL